MQLHMTTMLDICKEAIGLSYPVLANHLRTTIVDQQPVPVTEYYIVQIAGLNSKLAWI